MKKSILLSFWILFLGCFWDKKNKENGDEAPRESQVLHGPPLSVLNDHNTLTNPPVLPPWMVAAGAASSLGGVYWLGGQVREKKLLGQHWQQPTELENQIQAQCKDIKHLFGKKEDIQVENPIKNLTDIQLFKNQGLGGAKIYAAKHDSKEVILKVFPVHTKLDFLNQKMDYREIYFTCILSEMKKNIAAHTYSFDRITKEDLLIEENIYQDVNQRKAKIKSIISVFPEFYAAGALWAQMPVFDDTTHNKCTNNCFLVMSNEQKHIYPFMAMERLEGVTLSALANPHKETEVSEYFGVDGYRLNQAKYVKDTLHALLLLSQAFQIAHAELGLEHNDLHAGNIIFSKGSGGKIFPRVLDFGLSTSHLYSNPDVWFRKNRVGNRTTQVFYENLRGKNAYPHFAKLLFNNKGADLNQMNWILAGLQELILTNIEQNTGWQAKARPAMGLLVKRKESLVCDNWGDCINKLSELKELTVASKDWVD